MNKDQQKRYVFSVRTLLHFKLSGIRDIPMLFTYCIPLCNVVVVVHRHHFNDVPFQ